MDSINKTRAIIVYIIGIIITGFTIKEWINNYYIALVVSAFLCIFAVLIVEGLYQKKEKDNEKN